MFFLCLFGKGTKISKYLIDHDKVYQVVLKLGIQTDTGDREGSIIKEQDVDLKHLEEENVEKVLKSFFGQAKSSSTNVFCNKSEAEKNCMNMQEKEKKWI